MAQPAALTAVTLDDKYALDSGRIYLTGTQALVRLPMMQRQRDKAAGLDTAGFVTGYRGSPLGGIDQGIWQARSGERRVGQEGVSTSKSRCAPKHENKQNK